MPDLNELMKMAQEAQSKLMQAQEDLDKVEVEGVAGGGMVKVRATAKGRILAVEIETELVGDPGHQNDAVNQRSAKGGVIQVGIPRRPQQSEPETAEKPESRPGGPWRKRDEPERNDAEERVRGPDAESAQPG